MTTTLSRAATLMLLAGLGSAASCSDGPAKDSSTPEAGGEPGPRCYELVLACHYVDMGIPGPIHSCHTIGHYGPEAECDTEHDRCMALCKSAQPDGGDPPPHPTDGGVSDDAGHPHVDAAGHHDPKVPDAAQPTPGDIQKCIRLGNVCHDFDLGSGPGHDCHNIGHSGTPAECAASYDRCVALCTADAG